MAEGTQTPAERDAEQHATSEALSLARRIALDVYTHRISQLGTDVQVAYQRHVIEPLGRIQVVDPAARSRMAEAMRAADEIVAELDRAQGIAREAMAAGRVAAPILLSGPLLGGAAVAARVMARLTTHQGVEAAASLREWVRQVQPRLQAAAGLGAVAVLALGGGLLWMLSRRR